MVLKSTMGESVSLTKGAHSHQNRLKSLSSLKENTNGIEAVIKLG